MKFYVNYKRQLNMRTAAVEARRLAWNGSVLVEYGDTEVTVQTVDGTVLVSFADLFGVEPQWVSEFRCLVETPPVLGLPGRVLRYDASHVGVHIDVAGRGLCGVSVEGPVVVVPAENICVQCVAINNTIE